MGDCVLLTGGANEVVHVMALWETRDGVKRAEVRYFCNANAVDRSLLRATSAGAAAVAQRSNGKAVAKPPNEVRA